MKTLINKSWLTSMCDKVREATGETGLITIGENGAGLCEKIDGIPEPMGVYAWKRMTADGAFVDFVVDNDETAYPTAGNEGPDGYIYGRLLYIPIYSVGGKTWTQTNLTNAAFLDVCYADDLWVAAGYYNTSSSPVGLWWSIDGETWTQGNITNAGFNYVVYGNGKWVAASANGGIYYSTDGKNWSKSNKTNGTFKCLAYGNGIFVAGGSGIGIWYSTDGINWTQVSYTSSNYIYSVAYGNGLWVACDGDYTHYSTDGKNWSPNYDLNAQCAYIVYDNGRWILGSNNGGMGPYYSTDGKNWTEGNTKFGGMAFGYGNGLWVAGSYFKGVYYSTDDGKTWVQSNITDIRFKTIICSDGIWVAGSDGNGIYYSEDGKTWVQSNITSNVFGKILFVDNTLVACGGNESGDKPGVYYSKGEITGYNTEFDL